MIKEAYVSFEVAKLLNKKGFVQETLMVYNQNGNFMPNGAIKDTYQVFYSAPTHQMAMRWLREVHNLCIAPYAAAYRYGFTIDKADTGSNLGNEMKFYPEEEFETYEEAVEAALKYVLENLI